MKEWYGAILYTGLEARLLYISTYPRSTASTRRRTLRFRPQFNTVASWAQQTRRPPCPPTGNVSRAKKLASQPNIPHQQKKSSSEMATSNSRAKPAQETIPNPPTKKPRAHPSKKTLPSATPSTGPPSSSSTSAK